MSNTDEIQYQLDPRNARIHSDANKQAVRGSLQHLGAGRSVLADAEGVMVGGNAVYEQAQELGIPIREVTTHGEELIVVRRLDLATDDPRRKALALADNQITLLGEWDQEALDELFGDLADVDFAPAATGFDASRFIVNEKMKQIPEPFTPEEAGARSRSTFMGGCTYFPVIVANEDAELVAEWFRAIGSEDGGDGLERGKTLVAWIREKEEKCELQDR